MSMEAIKKLRAETGAGFTLCKEALDHAKGDYDKALQYLAQKGKDKVQKKSERTTKTGIIDVYSHGQDKNIGVMVEVNCETDFVSRTPEFREFAHEMALQIAAMNPLYIAREDVPAEVVKIQMKEFAKDATLAKKPKAIKEKILVGKMERFYEEACLIEQGHFRDQHVKVKQLLDQAIVKFGENVKIARFIRWHL